MESMKRKRIVLDPFRKCEIVKYSELHSKVTQRDIANHFTNLWDYPVSRRTVSDILSQREKWQPENVEKARKVARPAKEPKLEEALFLWLSNSHPKNVVTDENLREKAKRFGKELGVTDFSFSNGWLQRFKKRHAIHQHAISAESAAVDYEPSIDGGKLAAAVLERFAVRDVFGVNETGLLFRLMPDRSVVSTSVETKGTKEAKNRIAILLCVNADGSEKMKPLVIGCSPKPSSFRNFSHELYVDYRSNKKAWIDCMVFSEWVESFNTIMKLQSRHVLLVMDNTPSHAVPETLSNVTVHSLPATTMSRLRPFDVGIIESFKAQYRRLQLENITDCVENNLSTNITLGDAVRWVKRAWDTVSETIIRDCWLETGLIQRESQNTEVPTVSDAVNVDIVVLLQRVENSIIGIERENLMSPTEFIGADRDMEGVTSMSDEEIINAVKGEDHHHDPDDPEATPSPSPTTREVRTAVKTLFHFFEQCRFAGETDIDACLRMEQRIITLLQQNKHR